MIKIAKNLNNFFYNKQVIQKISQSHKILFNFSKAFGNQNQLGPAQEFEQRELLKQNSHDILQNEEFYQYLQKLYPNKEYFSAYVGFDPTADSLHLGNLITIIGIIRLSLLGFKPLLLVGGATGQIGDPSGKSVERQMIDKEQINKNIQGVEQTLRKVTESIYKYIKEKHGLEPKHKFEIVNNYDNYKDLNVLEFIRDVGKFYRMGNLLSKETIAKRINSEAGLSYTEFTYTILQGYDYERLFQEKNCVLQLGGSDQWGNILSGQEFIKKKHQSEVYCMTIPLITTSTGQKFGKSEGNALWIDLERQNPYDLYQYLLNTSDDFSIQLLKRFTFIPLEDIENLEKQHNEKPENRLAQKTLAQTIIDMLSANLKKDNQPQKNYADLVGQLFKTDFQLLAQQDFQKIDSFFEENSSLVINVTNEQINDCKNLIDLFVNLGNCKQSRKEIRRSIEGGGAKVNGNKITLSDSQDLQNLINNNLMANKYIVCKLGKKNFFLFKIQ